MNLGTKIRKHKQHLALIDIYGCLLSEKKIIYIKQHFFQDLSLKEIADLHHVSRAAVYDAINLGLKELENYEKKLHLLKKRNLRIEFIKNNILDKDIISRYIDLEYKQEK